MRERGQNDGKAEGAPDGDRSQPTECGAGLRLLPGRRAQLRDRPAARRADRRDDPEPGRHHARRPGVPAPGGRRPGPRSASTSSSTSAPASRPSATCTRSPRAINPQARIVYVDIDPVAVAHSRSILDGNERTAVIQADLRDPDVRPGRGARRPACSTSPGRSRCCWPASCTSCPDDDRPAEIARHRCATRSRPAATWRSRTRPTRTSRARCSTRSSCPARTATEITLRSAGPDRRLLRRFRAARARGRPHATVAAGVAGRRRRPAGAVRRLRRRRPQAGDHGAEHGVLCGAGHQPERARSAYAGRWARAVASGGFVPMSPTRSTAAARPDDGAGSRGRCVAEPFGRRRRRARSGGRWSRPT